MNKLNSSRVSFAMLSKQFGVYSSTNILWAAEKIIINPKKDNERLSSELRMQPEHFTSFIPKLVLDAEQKYENEKFKLRHNANRTKKRAINPIPPQQIAYPSNYEQVDMPATNDSEVDNDSINDGKSIYSKKDADSNANPPHSTSTPMRSTRISDTINARFYQFLSSSDSHQGEDCLNFVRVTSISLDAKLQSCAISLHVYDGIVTDRKHKSKILSILIQNERRFRRYLSQHMKFRAVPAIEFIFEKDDLESHLII